MKKIAFLILALLMIIPGSVMADDFLGVPLVPGGETKLKTDSRLEMKTKLSHDEVVAFYKNSLKKFKDIKFRDWKDSTYIEDDGALTWHSITISKKDETGASFVILKDNWTWIIGTLLIRFIAVFVVLLVLYLGMNISGRIISGLVGKEAAKKA